MADRVFNYRANDEPWGQKYILKILNKEVEISLFGAVADYISKVENSVKYKNKIYTSLTKQDFRELEFLLKSLYASIP